MLRAHFRNITQEDSKNFLASKCLLPISIGQLYHESEHLKAIIDLINAKFHSCILLVCDSLYRYTNMIENNSSPLENYFFAVKNGDEWIERNKEIISKAMIPTKVIRWDFWVFKNKHFLKYKKSLEYLYARDKTFQVAFDNSIKEFLIRYLKKTNIEDNDRAYKLCFDYLIEECAVLITIWKMEKYQFLIYPSNPVEAIEKTFTNFMGCNGVALVKWLKPRFMKATFSNIEYYLETANIEEISELLDVVAMDYIS